jgi:hypothetical protein
MRPKSYGEGPRLNGNRAFESWTQSDANMMGRAATKLSQELVAFWQSRFQADRWKAFASCHNPGEFFECQRQFAEKATAQYCDEASKLWRHKYCRLALPTGAAIEIVT